MNRQEIFNKVWAWFVTGNRPRCYDKTQGICLYHYEVDGVVNKCAVGCLLSDDLSKELEKECSGTAISNIQTMRPDLWNRVVAELGGFNDIQFLTDLQGHHDHPGFDLMKFLADNGLTVPVEA